MRKTNYMMTVEDVMEELGISKPAAYRIIRRLNSELQMAGYITVQAKIPRTYWNERFYTKKKYWRVTEWRYQKILKRVHGLRRFG